MSHDDFRINLSFIGHTSVGKTALGRTLLMEDIGEVSAKAHTTLTVEKYTLSRDRENCELLLWDTPGFSDSVRTSNVVARLKGQSNPLGWLRSQIFDRLHNRPLWTLQQTLTHIKEISDVILYLVNADEAPEHTAYLEAECEFLAWADKPVIVILNQIGHPLSLEDEKALVDRWSQAFKNRPFVKAVLPLDAFTRCWIQERALFETIHDLLPESRRGMYARLVSNWYSRHSFNYQQSITILAALLKRRLLDRVDATPKDFKAEILMLANQLGIKSAHNPTIEEAEFLLRNRGIDDLCHVTEPLLAVNGLQGKAGQRAKEEIYKRLKNTALSQHSDSTWLYAGAMGAGVGSAASAGLFIDLASGGLTLGLGTLIGGLIGAVGGAKAADIYQNKTNPGKKSGVVLAWSDKALNDFLVEMMLLYLAVSHFGRGRGHWEDTEYSPYWESLVRQTLNDNPVDWTPLRDNPEDATKPLEAILDTRLRLVFKTLYNREP